MNITYIVSTDWDHFWPPIHNVQGLKLFSAMATRIFWSLWVLWWIYYIVSVFKYVFSVQQSIGRRRILKELLHTAPEKRSEKVLDMCYLHADEKDFPTDELFEHLDKKFKRMEKEGFIESNGEINDIPVGGGNGDEDDALRTILEGQRDVINGARRQESFMHRFKDCFLQRNMLKLMYVRPRLAVVQRLIEKRELERAEAQNEQSRGEKNGEVLITIK